MAAKCCSAGEISGLANTLQGHVDDIRTLIQCGICIRPLYEPFTLACGHTFCYSCLSSWFAGGKSKRTCPDCRAPVKTQPAPAYLVRAVVQMFTARAELLDKGETTMEHTKNRQEEAGKLDEDKANNHPTQGGLFGGLFRPKAPLLKPVNDVDDGVMRCPHCSWELEEGEQCANCGYRYPGSETGETESSEESESGSDDDDDDSDGMEDDDSEDGSENIDDTNGGWAPNQYPINGPNFGMQPLPGFPSDYHLMGHLHYHDSLMLPGIIPRFNAHYDPDEFDYEEDEDEDENEYDHEDSFINDATQLTSADYESDSDHSTVVRSSQRSLPPVRHGHQEDDDDDEEDDDPQSSSAEERGSNSDSVMDDSSDEDDIRAVPARQAFGNTPQHAWVIPTSSPWAQSMQRAQRAQRAHEASTSSAGTVNLDSESEEEERETSDISRPASSSPPAASTRPNTVRGLSARNVITLDDSDDEEPVGPVRRNTQRRQNRYSPY